MSPTPPRAPAGSAMVEFTIVALPLLLTGFVAFETARWMLARQAVGYALFEAARAGSVSGADPAAMRDAFERGLAPALAVAEVADPAQLAAAVRGRMARWEGRHGLRLARIEQLSPGRASFDDFADAALRAPDGARRIDNSYQRERHDRLYAARYRHGIGPRSAQTLFDANTLVLRLTYLHAPALPGVRALLRHAVGAAGADDPDDYARRARAAGLLVIHREIAIPMQSHPREHPAGRDILDPGLRTGTGPQPGAG